MDEYLTRPALVVGELADCIGAAFEVERLGPFALRATDADGSTYRVEVTATSHPDGLDPFPLAEEADLRRLPTVSDWLAAGAPMREVS